MEISKDFGSQDQEIDSRFTNRRPLIPILAILVKGLFFSKDLAKVFCFVSFASFWSIFMSFQLTLNSSSFTLSLELHFLPLFALDARQKQVKFQCLPPLPPTKNKPPIPSSAKNYSPLQENIYKESISSPPLTQTETFSSLVFLQNL